MIEKISVAYEAVEERTSTAHAGKRWEARPTDEHRALRASASCTDRVSLAPSARLARALPASGHCFSEAVQIQGIISFSKEYLGTCRPRQIKSASAVKRNTPAKSRHGQTCGARRLVFT